MFLHKCLLNSPPRFRHILSNSLYSLGCYSNVKGKVSKKYSQIFFSEAVRQMKLKLCIHAYDISLYKVCVFYCPCPTTLVAMATTFSLTYKTKSGKLQFFENYCSLRPVVDANN